MFQVNPSVIFATPWCPLKVPQKKKRNHTALMKLRKTNRTLLSSFYTKPLEVVCNLPYGAAPNVHKEHVCAIKKENLLTKIVSFKDQKAFTKAMLVPFTTENSIPSTLVPHINLARLCHQFKPFPSRSQTKRKN